MTRIKFAWAYDAVDQPTSFTRSSWTGSAWQTVATSTYAYDTGHRLTGMTRYADVSSTTLGTLVYAYDLADRVTQKVENGVTTNYGYDHANQLTADGATNHTYDGTGNRGDATVTAGNRITTDGTYTYTHDDEGNVIRKTTIATDETWAYTYNHNNQLTNAARYETSTLSRVNMRVTYTYDAFENRVERSSWVKSPAATSTERYGYDGWDTAKPIPVANENFDGWVDLDSSNNLTMRRLYDGQSSDAPVARQDAGGTVNWYGTDSLGSITQTFTSSGTITSSLSYDGFGNLLSGVRLDRFGYTGREWDDTLGLQYSRARMYDPDTGRWLQEDPLGFGAGDANLHRYVGNSPTNATDPSGLIEGGGGVQGMLGDYLGVTPPAATYDPKAELLPMPMPMPTYEDFLNGNLPRAQTLEMPLPRDGDPFEPYLADDAVMRYDWYGNPIRREPRERRTGEDILNDFILRNSLPNITLLISDPPIQTQLKGGGLIKPEDKYSRKPGQADIPHKPQNPIEKNRNIAGYYWDGTRVHPIGKKWQDKADAIDKMKRLSTADLEQLIENLYSDLAVRKAERYRYQMYGQYLQWTLDKKTQDPKDPNYIFDQNVPGKLDHLTIDHLKNEIADNNKELRNHDKAIDYYEELLQDALAILATRKSKRQFRKTREILEEMGYKFDIKGNIIDHIPPSFTPQGPANTGSALSNGGVFAPLPFVPPPKSGIPTTVWVIGGITIVSIAGVYYYYYGLTFAELSAAIASAWRAYLASLGKPIR